MEAPAPTSPALSPCPFLPQINRRYSADEIHALGRDRSATFYHTALHYAQSLWLEGFPAKSLLLVNRALSCHLPEVSLQSEGFRPYHAVAWILQHRPEGQFIGNPRRHYQHLATRMVDPHKTLRTWRAWACWYLSKHLLPESEHPSDEKQIREEGIVEPRRLDIVRHLTELSPSDDAAAWQAALKWAGEHWSPVSHLQFVPARREDLPTVEALAREIWPQVYRELITPDQIQYMLGLMYNVPHLEEEVSTRGVRYQLIREEDGSIVGFLGWELEAGVEPERSTALLHKLYVKPNQHGRGIGASALTHVIEEATAEGASALQLRVNRQNRKAIRAYLRAGFEFEEDRCTDIGGGFVMDDHVMAKRL
jgi:GNAT superfamily N-acetyltransferase